MARLPVAAAGAEIAFGRNAQRIGDIGKKRVPRVACELVRQGCRIDAVLRCEPDPFAGDTRQIQQDRHFRVVDGMGKAAGFGPARQQRQGIDAIIGPLLHQQRGLRGEGVEVAKPRKRQFVVKPGHVPRGQACQISHHGNAGLIPARDIVQRHAIHMNVEHVGVVARKREGWEQVHPACGFFQRPRR